MNIAGGPANQRGQQQLGTRQEALTRLPRAASEGPPPSGAASGSRPQAGHAAFTKPRAYAGVDPQQFTSGPGGRVASGFQPFPIQQSATTLLAGYAQQQFGAPRGSSTLLDMASSSNSSVLGSDGFKFYPNSTSFLQQAAGSNPPAPPQHGGEAGFLPPATTGTAPNYKNLWSGAWMNGFAAAVSARNDGNNWAAAAAAADLWSPAAPPYPAGQQVADAPRPATQQQTCPAAPPPPAGGSPSAQAAGAGPSATAAAEAAAAAAAAVDPQQWTQQWAQARAQVGAAGGGGMDAAQFQSAVASAILMGLPPRHQQTPHVYPAQSTGFVPTAGDGGAVGYGSRMNMGFRSADTAMMISELEEGRNMDKRRKHPPGLSWKTYSSNATDYSDEELTGTNMFSLNSSHAGCRIPFAALARNSGRAGDPRDDHSGACRLMSQQTSDNNNKTVSGIHPSPGGRVARKHCEDQLMLFQQRVQQQQQQQQQQQRRWQVADCDDEDDDDDDCDYDEEEVDVRRPKGVVELAKGFRISSDGQPDVMELDGTLVFITCHSLRALRNAIAPLVSALREPTVDELFRNARTQMASRNQQVTWVVMFKTRRQARAVVRYLGGQGHDVRLADEPELAFTNIYIANLPAHVNQREVERLVSTFGSITSVKVLKDADEEKNLGVAFANLSSSREAVTAIRGIHNRRIDGWDSMPYARLAYRYGKQAYVARLLRIVSNNVQPAVRNAALKGCLVTSGMPFNFEEKFGLFWSTTHLALLSLSQLHRLAKARNAATAAAADGAGKGAGEMADYARAPRVKNDGDGVDPVRVSQLVRVCGARLSDRDDDDDEHTSDDDLTFGEHDVLTNAWSPSPDRKRVSSALDSLLSTSKSEKEMLFNDWCANRLKNAHRAIRGEHTDFNPPKGTDRGHCYPRGFQQEGRSGARHQQQQQQQRRQPEFCDSNDSSCCGSLLVSKSSEEARFQAAVPKRNETKPRVDVDCPNEDPRKNPDQTNRRSPVRSVKRSSSVECQQRCSNHHESQMMSPSKACSDDRPGGEVDEVATDLLDGARGFRTQQKYVPPCFNRACTTWRSCNTRHHQPEDPSAGKTPSHRSAAGEGDGGASKLTVSKSGSPRIDGNEQVPTGGGGRAVEITGGTSADDHQQRCQAGNDDCEAFSSAGTPKGAEPETTTTTTTTDKSYASVAKGKRLGSEEPVSTGSHSGEEAAKGNKDCATSSSSESTSNADSGNGSLSDSWDDTPWKESGSSTELEFQAWLRSRERQKALTSKLQKQQQQTGRRAKKQQPWRK